MPVDGSGPRIFVDGAVEATPRVAHSHYGGGHFTARPQKLTVGESAVDRRDPVDLGNQGRRVIAVRSAERQAAGERIPAIEEPVDSLADKGDILYGQKGFSHRQEAVALEAQELVRRQLRSDGSRLFHRGLVYADLACVSPMSDDLGAEGRQGATQGACWPFIAPPNRVHANCTSKGVARLTSTEHGAETLGGQRHGICHRCGWTGIVGVVRRRERKDLKSGHSYGRLCNDCVMDVRRAQPQRRDLHGTKLVIAGPERHRRVA
jgi:hypothetical protein